MGKYVKRNGKRVTSLFKIFTFCSAILLDRSFVLGQHLCPVLLSGSLFGWTFERCGLHGPWHRTLPICPTHHRPLFLQIVGIELFSNQRKNDWFDFDFSFGSGGLGSKTSAMCVLPMNMINQKVFTIVYFWLALLLIASIMWITLRIFLIASSTFRKIWWSFFFGVNTTNVSKKASGASNLSKKILFFRAKCSVVRLTEISSYGPFWWKTWTLWPTCNSWNFWAKRKNSIKIYNLFL